MRDGVVSLHVRVFCVRRDWTEFALRCDLCFGLRIRELYIEACGTISTETVHPELVHVKGDGLSSKVRLQHRIVGAKLLDDQFVRLLRRPVPWLRLIEMHAQSICFQQGDAPWPLQEIEIGALDRDPLGMHHRLVILRTPNIKVGGDAPGTRPIGFLKAAELDLSLKALLKSISDRSFSKWPSQGEHCNRCKQCDHDDRSEYDPGFPARAHPRLDDTKRSAAIAYSRTASLNAFHHQHLLGIVDLAELHFDDLAVGGLNVSSDELGFNR